MTSAGNQKSPRRPAPITAGRGRHAPESPQAPPALTPKGEALAARLPVALAEFEPEIGADIDEVTCRIAPRNVAAAAARLKEAPELSFKYIRLLSAVDYIADEGEIELVYHLYSLEHQHKMVLKARVPDSDPTLPSVTSVWRGADWYEREMHDLFGVVFENHPDFRRLILPDDFDGFPGRKAYPLNDYDEW